MPHQHHYSKKKDLLRFRHKILDITSQRGHTRGGHINEADDLASLLEAIQIKTGVSYASLDHNETLDRYHNLGRPLDMDTSSQWKKQGDFTQAITYHALNRSVYYINSDASNKIISSIQLSRYHNGRLTLKLVTSNDLVYAQL